MGFCVLALFTSCSSDPDDNGASFNPDYKKLEVFVDSSANLKVYSVLAERMFVGTNDTGIFGYVHDPIFGEYNTNMLGIASPLDYKFSFEDSVVVTSLKLYINYYSVYGDKKESIPLSIYELLKDSTTSIDDLIGTPDNENSIKKFWDGKDLLVKAEIPGSSDDVESGSEQQYTIDLLSTLAGNELANRLISTDSVYNTKDSYNNINLLHENIFKGLYFKVDVPTGESSVVKISSSSYMELGIGIYLYDSVAKKRKLVQETIGFSLSDSGRVSVFERKYKPQIEKNIYDTLYEPSLSELDTVFYLHGMHGISARVVVSELDSIFNFADYVIVNNAELILYLEDEGVYEEDNYSALDKFDVYVNGEPTESNYLGSVGKSYGEYRIILTSYLNDQISKGAKKFVLDLVPYDSEITPNRSVFKGVNNSNEAVQLKITYTKFNIN